MAIIDLDNVSIESKYIDEPKRIIGIFHSDVIDNHNKGFMDLVKDKKDVEWCYVNLHLGSEYTIVDALIVVQLKD
jgi:hypothetical protein